MPLTELQTRLLRVLAENRSPDSYVAGGSVLNAGADTGRFSADIDLFSDRIEALARSVEADAAIDGNGEPGLPDLAGNGASGWRIHAGSRGGAWPSSSEISGEMLRDAARKATERSDPKP